MSYIHLNTPPSALSYSYTVPNNAVKSKEPSHLNMIKSRIGNLINADYETGAKMTPKKKERIAAITLTALATIAAVGLLAAGLATGILPLCFVAIPLIFGAFALGIWAVKAGCDEDIHSPKEREQIRQKVALETFHNMASGRSSSYIISYQLLDKLVPVETIPEKNRTLFYARFEDLHKEWADLHSWRSQNLATVETQLDRETAPLRSWYADQKRIIDQQRALMGQGEATLRQAAINRDLHNRPHAASRLHTAANVATVVNVVTEFQLQRQLDEINQVYGAKMAPWNAWRAQERRTVEAVYDQSRGVIEGQYTWMKQAAFA